MNISATYDTGRKSMFRRWLISDPDLRRLSSLEAGKNLLGKRSLSNQNFRSVALVGPGTIGTPVGARNPSCSRHPEYKGRFLRWFRKKECRNWRKHAGRGPIHTEAGPKLLPGKIWRGIWPPPQKAVSRKYGPVKMQWLKGRR